MGDLNGDGVPEIVIGARAPRPELFYLARRGDGTWGRRLIDDGFETLEAGGVLADLDGDGDLDLLAGQDARGDRLFWWECPDDPDRPWTRREVCRMPGRKSHDQLVADIDGDGRPEVTFWNQGSRTLFCAPIPDDPRVSPWPDIRPVATDVSEEGLCAADLDGDGRPELIAGQSWYRPLSGGRWERHPFAEGCVSPRLTAADFDGDGRPEIILSEGDASLNRRPYGRLIRFRPGADPEALWEPEVLHERLLDPHSLSVADFDGDGHPDLYVGEMGLPDGSDPHPPAQRIFLSRGSRLEEHVIDRGLGAHEAKAIEMDGRAGIVSKPFRLARENVPRTPEIDGIHLYTPKEEIHARGQP
jgi:hypothetical protein